MHLLELIAANPGTPPSVLAAIAATSGLHDAHVAAAANPATPHDVALRLATGDPECGRAWLEAGPRRADDVLAVLGTSKNGRLLAAAVRSTRDPRVVAQVLSSGGHNTTLMWGLLRDVDLDSATLMAIAATLSALLTKRGTVLKDSERKRLCAQAAAHPSVRADLIALFDDEPLRELAEPYLNPDPALVHAPRPARMTIEALRQWVCAADRTLQQVLEACRASGSSAPWRSLIRQDYPHARTLAEMAVLERTDNQAIMTTIAAAAWLPTAVRYTAAMHLPVVTYGWANASVALRSLLPLLSPQQAEQVMRRQLALAAQERRYEMYWWSLVDVASARDDLPDDVLDALLTQAANAPARVVHSPSQLLWFTVHGPQDLRERALAHMQRMAAGHAAFQAAEAVKVTVGQAGVRAASVGDLAAVRDIPMSAFEVERHVLRFAVALFTRALAQALPGLSDERAAMVFVALSQGFSGTFGELLDVAPDLAR